MTNDLHHPSLQQAGTRQDAALAVPPKTRRSRVAVLALVVFGVAVLGAGAAQAQRKKITLDDLVIEGNIQKPEAFFILPRTNLNFADLERREDLKARIVEAVELKPF